jgi:predicted N-acetyltransferase YhbS
MEPSGSGWAPDASGARFVAGRANDDAMNSLSIRRLADQDVDACVEVASAVGWNTDPGAWRQILSLGDAAGAQLPDGKLAGTIAVIPFGRTLATIAMMLVRPTLQRQGLGPALMEHALASSPARVHCLYATAAGQRLYRRFGFVEAGSSTRFEGAVAESPFEAHAGLRPMTPSDVAAVLEMDETAQGARRQRLVESLAERRDVGWVVEREGRLCGFGMALADGELRRVGPLVAARDDDAIAIADRLVAGATRIRLDLEPGEGALRAWAQARGLGEQETSLRMTLGSGSLPGTRAHSRLLAGRPFG